jgi:hypothetical protein
LNVTRTDQIRARSSFSASASRSSSFMTRLDARFQSTSAQRLALSRGGKGIESHDNNSPPPAPAPVGRL